MKNILRSISRHEKLLKQKHEKDGNMNRTGILLALILWTGSAAVEAAEIKIGETLAPVSVEEAGMLVPEYTIVNERMTHKEGTDIDYRPWSSSELTGRIRTVYHLAARIGMDDINAHYIDAIIAGDLDEDLPDSPYQTVTILNTDDALWGTSGLAKSRMEDSQKTYPYAGYVIDDEGRALEAWGLQPKNSAVIIIDADGKVLWFKEGKLTDAEVTEAVGLIKEKLAELRASDVTTPE